MLYYFGISYFGICVGTRRYPYHRRVGLVTLKRVVTVALGIFFYLYKKKAEKNVHIFHNFPREP